MQLSIDRFITQPQQNNTTPTRAAIAVDLTNMFNSVSQAELFDIIHTDFPELASFTSLLYDTHGGVHFKWNQTDWKTLHMKEGVNQGCLLSPIFATLVLHRILKPLAESLHEHAHTRLSQGNTGDDGCGGISHLFAYMDDISSTVPLQDISFFCSELKRLGTPRGCFVNPFKTRILTSTNGTSILPQLQITNPLLANDLTTTLATYSIQQSSNTTATPTELTSGFRLLGTPVGSHTFANIFDDKHLTEIFSSLDPLEQAIPDIHTRFKIFNQCILQKLPHLLDSAVMHSYPTNDANNPWYNWEGNLSFGIDNLLHSFLRATLDIETEEHLPTYSVLIAHINTNKGCLGMINASLQAAPDFVLNMMISKRRALQGFSINKDTHPICLHPSISDLYTQTTNPHSIHLQRYATLLPQIGPICCPEKCPQAEKLHLFESSLSHHHSTCSCINYSANILLGQLYTEVQTNTPEQNTSTYYPASSHPKHHTR